MRILIFILALLATPAWALDPETPPNTDVNAPLDALHRAASEADGKTYFDLFTKDAIYIGTDASERWTIAQFRAYAEPYFAQGKGWTYTVRERHFGYADIACKCVVWFDELLDSESYGTSRGTGVLVLQNNEWKIAQYALTFPIPNDLAKEVTSEIKAFEAKAKSEQK